LSFTPTLIYKDTSPDPNIVCRDGLEKAGMMFFYTVGKDEVQSWLVEKGTDAVTCAGKIHSDLARGFIRAEIISSEDMMTAHNMQDARSKGLTKLVNRDYIIPKNTVLEIRFNV
jgi:ribosome-binding ATPase YchF (GTP1/OBG family)